MSIIEHVSGKQLSGIRSEQIRIPNEGRLVHLQFRRFAGCPVCKLHLRSIAQRHEELVRAGIVEAAVFHSSRDALLRHDIDLPFHVIADPERKLYREFGVETSIRSILDPRAWGAIVRGLSVFGPGPPDRGESGLGLPADFLIASDGTVIACKYGAHADDHWSVDEILRLAAQRNEPGYLPAAGHHAALPLYDPLVRLLGIDKARQILVEQASVKASHRVLDIGCGTGTLAVLIGRLCPGIDITGLDPDPRALERARRKAERAAAPIRFERGFSQKLPCADASFDRVFSSFMLHHVPAEQKLDTLREVRRVLKPGGALHLLDFSRPQDETRILTLLREAGLKCAQVTKTGNVLLGLLRIAYYSAAAGQ